MLNNRSTIWQIDDDPPSSSWLAKKVGISGLLASLLINRNITLPESAESFLSPRLGALRDPFLHADMDKAVEVIAGFIEKPKKVTIYGDYDADGITATALLVDFLSRLGMRVSFYIPHRLEEGYGLNEDAIRKIAADHSGLIITVDCGINSQSEISMAKELGMEMIVTDHHQVPPDFEPACPTVNPLRPDSSFPFKELAGVGVAFYLAIAVRSHLRKAGFFKKTAEPDLRPYLDIVALGTVADMVPLREENRILVDSGLAVLSESKRPGIRALMEVSGIKKQQPVTTEDIAYKLAPRLNAMGRLGPAADAVRLLTTSNEAEASSIAGLMDSLNVQRQAIQNRIFLESSQRIEKMKGLGDRRTIVLFDPGWHRGIVGIVASKIVETYCRPALILAVEGNLLRGSGRSIEGFDLYRALSDLSDLLDQFGGHNHAAGVTLEHDKINEFQRRFEELARERIDETDMAQKIAVDSRLGFDSINGGVVKDIEMLSPFGCQNPPPVFWAGPLHVIFSRVVGKGHLKLRLRADRTVFDCMAFGRAALHPLTGQSVEILFHLGTNVWQGRESIQPVIVDLRSH